MNTIFNDYYKDSNVKVIETTDQQYAHDCFDGTESEWEELLTEFAPNIPGNNTFYIVSAGLAGLYMADSVAVFTNRTDAINDAKRTIEDWKDQDEETEESEPETL